GLPLLSSAGVVLIRRHLSSLSNSIAQQKSSLTTAPPGVKFSSTFQIARKRSKRESIWMLWLTRHRDRHATVIIESALKPCINRFLALADCAIVEKQSGRGNYDSSLNGVQGLNTEISDCDGGSN